MDKKQLSQLDPKLKAVYDRVMGIANSAPPPLNDQISATPNTEPSFPVSNPAMEQPAPLSTPFPITGEPVTTSEPLPQIATSPSPIGEPSPMAPASPSILESAVGSQSNVTPSAYPPPPAGKIPTFQTYQEPAMQSMHSTMPIVTPPAQNAAIPSSGKGFMVVFIILGIIFFILYAVFWIQLFHIGIPPFS